MVGHIVSKLIRRHPHVFGDVEVTGADHVVRNWEVIKAGEREAKAKAGRKFESAQAAEQGLEGTGLLLSVPRAMPGLERAQQLQVRAARVGFDWTNIEGVFDKVREELAELQAEESKERRTEEMGDLLFALVVLSEWMGINAEEALRRANDKFIRRFTSMEQAIVAGGGKLRGMSVEDMDLVGTRSSGMSSNPRRRYVAARPLPDLAAAPPGAPPLGLSQARARSQHSRHPHRRTLMVLLVLGPLCLAAIVAFKVWVDNQTAGLIYMPDDSNLPANHVAMVFGAGLDASAALPPCFTTG